MANRYWTERDWPIDFGGYRFIGRAVHDMGRATFGHEWTGDEPASEFKGTFKRTPPLTREDQWANWRLFERLVPKDVSRPINMATKIGRPPLVPAELWTMATVALEERNTSWRRYEKARNELLGLFQSGKVQTAIRDHEGGEIGTVPRWHWNSEDLNYRFECGKMDAESPFAPVESYQSPKAAWIFVDRGDLIANLPNIFTDPLDTDEIQGSDLLRFAISFNDRFPEDVKGKTKKELENRLKAEWPYKANPLPPESQKAIALVLRDLDRQRGRAIKAN